MLSALQFTDETFINCPDLEQYIMVKSDYMQIGVTAPMGSLVIQLTFHCLSVQAVCFSSNTIQLFVQILCVGLADIAATLLPSVIISGGLIVGLINGRDQDGNVVICTRPAHSVCMMSLEIYAYMY